MNQLPTDLLKSFDKAREDKTPLHLKGVMPDVPKWEHFIDNIYNKVNSDQIMQFRSGRNFKDVAIYNYLDLFIPFAAENNNENGLIGLQKVIDFLKDNLDVSFFNIKSIINFAGYEADYWPHEDPNDVISWHCIGNVEWRIHSNGSYKSYYLKPGDLFFCPAGTTHEIVVSEPRASVVLDFNPINV